MLSHLLLIDSHGHDSYMDQYLLSNFEVFEQLDFDEWLDHEEQDQDQDQIQINKQNDHGLELGSTLHHHDHHASSHNLDQGRSSLQLVDGSGTSSLDHHGNSFVEEVQNGDRRVERYAFKTKSDVEVLVDGYKWRKYGKKMVKNNPNPRNYYRCSSEGCAVKKIVERDGDDRSYVITTYQGIHNHQSPSHC